MTIALIGFNYKTSPLDLLERLHIPVQDMPPLLADLHGDFIAEVTIVSTCNRLEVYAVTEDFHGAVDRVITLLAGRGGLAVETLREHMHVKTDENAVTHLMRVSAGLESILLGETEILGQITEALRQAQEANTISALLSRLFHDAIHAGKRARTETAISQHTLSLSHAAVLLAKQHVPDLAAAHVLVIGAGRMAELAVSALLAHNVRSIQVINRSYVRAQSLTDHYGIAAREWNDLQRALRETNIVFAATSAGQPVLHASDIPDGRRLVLIDIAVPRNVHPDVRYRPNVQLFDMSDLHGVVESHRAKRQAEAAQVERIIEAETTAYVQWLNSRSAVSTIVAMREKAHSVAALELERALNRLPDLSEHEQEIVTRMTQRIVNKLLHAPTAALRERTADGDHFGYLHAARMLFDLHTETDYE